MRLDGYEIRTAAVMANVPCITTVQGLGAAVQGIEARRRGDIGVRSLQDWAAPARRRRRLTVTAYQRLFEHGFAPPRPRAGPPPGLPRASARGGPGAAPAAAAPARPVDGDGPARSRTRSGWRPASTRTPSASTPSAASGSATSRSARSPAAPSPATRTPRLFRLVADRAVVNRMGFNNDGAEVVAARLRRRAADRRRRRAGARRQHRQDQGRARGRRGGRARRLRDARPACSRPTPTTSSSTSARPTPPACAACRRSSGSARCSSTCAGSPTASRDRRGCRCWSRSPPTSPTTTSSPSPTSPWTIGLDGIVATNTTISRDGLRSHPDEVADGRRRGALRAPADRPRRSRSCGCCAAASAPT